MTYRTRLGTRAWTIAIALAVLADAPIGSQGPAGGVQSTPALSPRNANYDIDVTLDPATRTMTGAETIEWRNIGAIRSAPRSSS